MRLPDSQFLSSAFTIRKETPGGLDLSDSKLDIKTLSYLWTYGSTLEIDLMDWGVRRLDQSAESLKTVLDEMDAVGRIRRIVHGELEPQVVYVAIGPTLEFGLQLGDGRFCGYASAEPGRY